MNGRVDITGHNNTDRFLLYERPENKKSTDYKNALVGNFHASTLPTLSSLLQISLLYKMLF
jgi:hypothetical protein